MIELTETQVKALDAPQQPAVAVDPRTGQVYVLIRKEVYDLTCSIIGGGKGKAWDDEADDDLIRKDA